jgi:hypothetical protein
MIASNIPPISDWCLNVQTDAGDFLKAFAEAVLRADEENLVILLPAISALMEKYPKYCGPYGKVIKIKGS